MSSQTVVGNLAVELGMSTEEFQRALAHAQVQAQKAAQNIQSKINSAGSSAMSGNAQYAGRNAHGILAFSRAIDDMQYGLRGVINNIEGIALGFGMSAGVAGMATMAAVAIQAMLPAIDSVANEAQKLFGTFETGAERAQRSVQGMMGGGFGMGAMSAALKEQAEFLMNRTDSTVGWKIEPLLNALNLTSIAADAVENNTRRATEAAALMAKSFRVAADASKAMQASQRGASAQYDLTSDQQSQVGLNRQLFQSAVDRFRGGDNLRTKLTMEARKTGMIPSNAERLYGQFAAGEIPATNKVIGMLGLQAEMTKVLADDYERMTGQAAELARIEEQRANQAKLTAEFIDSEARWFENAARQDERREMDMAGRDFDKQLTAFEQQWKQEERIANRQFGEYENAASQQDNLFSRRDSIMAGLNRSEIIGSADVFARNLNAGQKSEELKELEKINESIKELGTLTGVLN